MLMGLYLWIFLVPDPRPGWIPPRTAGLFELIPLVCFAVILFPQLNRHHPAGFTRNLGRVGLVMASFALSLFKLFIW